jgi:hypothetical protein
MKYYRMHRDIAGNGAILYGRNHDLVELKTGVPLELKSNEPFLAELDPEIIDGEMPTFFESPGLITTKEFYEDLLKIGITNLEKFPLIIEDKVHNRTIDTYVFLNIIGRFACVDMAQTQQSTLGDEPNLTLLDNPVLIGNKIPHDMDLFVLDEDTDCMIVSEKVYDYFQTRPYTDIYWEELKIV